VRHLFDYSSVPHEKRTLILAAMLFGSVLSYLLIVRYGVSVGEVEGTSMTPTLQDGERYLINRMVYRFHDPRPGDIVEIAMPKEDDCSVKRIIALPGDVIQIKEGRVHVNGKPCAEPYLPAHVMTRGNSLGTNAYKVLENTFFVMGDNRAVSADSRVFGAVPRDRLVGRLVIW
jgi:signal peptidase I